MIETRTAPTIITAEEADVGTRLDRVLADRVEGLSRSRAQALIRAGAVTRADKTIGDPGVRVKPGEIFVLQLPEAEFKPRRTMLLLLLFTETITYYHQYQRELKTDEDTGDQYIETTIEDIQAAFNLLETTLLKPRPPASAAWRAESTTTTTTAATGAAEAATTTTTTAAIA